MLDFQTQINNFRTGSGALNTPTFRLLDVVSLEKTEDENKFTLSIDNESAIVSIETIKAYFLMCFYKDSRGNVRDWLDTLSRESITRKKQSGDSKPIPGHYLTSADYLRNCLKLAVPNLIAGMAERQDDSLLSAEQRNTLTVLREKESALISAEKELRLNGFADVKLLSEKSLSAVLDTADLTRRQVAATLAGLEGLLVVQQTLEGDNLIVIFELV